MSVRGGPSRAEFSGLDYREIELWQQAYAEREEQRQKADAYRDARLFSVIATCTTGKPFKTEDFIDDPEAEMEKLAAEQAYEKAMMKSRDAYKRTNGPKGKEPKDETREHKDSL